MHMKGKAAIARSGKVFFSFSLALCLFIYTACDRTPGRGAKRQLDACSFFTKAEVESVLGIPLKDPEKKEDNCMYESKDPASFTYLLVTTFPVKKNAREEFETAIKEIGKHARINDVQRVGDRAYLVELNTLYILKGDAWIALNIISSVKKSKEILDLLSTLGPKAASRM